MSDPTDHGRGGPENCAECGAQLAADQRYCFECGARRGPLPALVKSRLEDLRGRERPAFDGEEAATVSDGEEDEGGGSSWRFMPSPQVAAVVVMALLAAGVVIGAVTSPLARSAGFAPIILSLGSPHRTAAPPGEEPVEEEAETFVPEEEAVAAAPLVETPPPPVPEEEAPAPPQEPAVIPPELEAPTLPEAKHVFVIVLHGHGYEESFGEASTEPYFKEELPAQGELLRNYYAVAKGALANEIALLSGQGPTPETATNCPEYKPVVPGTVSEEEGQAGQVLGSGCVYPRETQALPSQLAKAKMSWRAYVEDIGNGEAAGQPTSCRHPALETADPSQAPLPGDAFETWRNPFVYFAGLTESPECAEDDVGLDRLETDLKDPKKTPAFSYIVPNACHDGSETPCAPEQPAGLAAAKPFLETTIEEIKESQSYREGGLIALTFDEAPREGPNADASSCCATPAYPNLPKPTTPPQAATGPVRESGGGGQVGLLLISPFVEPGTVEESGYYNHFSLLRLIEELFGLEQIGYAASPTLTAIEPEVFNAAS